MAADFRRLIEDSREMTRRSFLAIAGWGGFTVASLIALYQSLKFVYPNATYEDPPAFKADPPSAYAVGSTTVLIDKRVVINHDPNGFYAISLICTHLGCTPRWFQNDNMFRCPCHGSRYLRSGVRFYGPAPRPMDTVSVARAADGTLLVDRGKLVERTARLQV